MKQPSCCRGGRRDPKPRARVAGRRPGAARCGRAARGRSTDERRALEIDCAAELLADIAIQRRRIVQSHRVSDDRDPLAHRARARAERPQLVAGGQRRPRIELFHLVAEPDLESATPARTARQRDRGDLRVAHVRDERGVVLNDGEPSAEHRQPARRANVARADPLPAGTVVVAQLAHRRDTNTQRRIDLAREATTRLRCRRP